MITWALLSILLPFWVIIEIVPTFDEDVVRRHLGPFYNIESVLLGNLDFGLTVCRVRTYVVLTLKTTLSSTRPLTDIIPTFSRKRDSGYNWRSILSTHRAELWAEIMWSQRRTDGEKVTSDPERDPTEADLLRAPANGAGTCQLLLGAT